MITTKHEADGLYSFSYARAVELHACYMARDNWKTKHSDGIVPVTLKVMLTQHKIVSSVGWCFAEMNIQKRITIAEHYKYWRQYCNATNNYDEVMALMDCLAARARREGILT